MGKIKLNEEYIIIGIVFFLGLFSILGTYSAVSSLSYRNSSFNTEIFLVKQFFLLIFCISIIFFTRKIDFRYFFFFSKLGIFFSIPLLIFTWKYGVNLNSASRWIKIPMIQKSFQPSELASISLIIYLSNIFSKNFKKIEDENLILKSFVLICTICGLISLANASYAICLFTICIIIIFLSDIPFKKLLKFFAIGFGLCIAFISIGQRKKTFISRIENFFSNEISFQNKHSYLAIINGGIKGMGPGNSIERNILPHPYSDFIFSILTEEYGILGSILIIFTYLMLFYLILKKFFLQKDIKKKMMSISLAIYVIFQAFLNISVSVGIVPVTGLVLPFISMGGTSMIFSAICFGIIINSLYEKN